MTHPRQQGKYFKTLACEAARAAADKKGMEITLLHTSAMTTIADYMLLVSVTSPPHMSAVEENIRRHLKSAGNYAQHRDGRRSDLWRVLDYGGLLIHLMHPKAREFYALDKLYHEARPIAWNGERGKEPKKKRNSVKRPSMATKKTAKAKSRTKKTAKPKSRAKPPARAERKRG